MELIGLRIQPYGKSLHNGHTGVITADYGEFVMVKADDPSYVHAHKSFNRDGTTKDGRYFQVDSLLYKVIKCTA